MIDVRGGRSNLRGHLLDIVKVDATNMTTPLSGAKFTLRKLNPDGTGAYLDGDSTESDATGNDGKTSFADIRDGYYEISETKVPDGYVLLDSGKFYLKVVDSVVTRIQKAEDNPETTNVDESLVKNWPDAAVTDLISLTRAEAAVADDPATTDVNESKDATNDTFTVGNTPGAKLPSTGGPGTTGLYILGSILTLLAAVLLITKKRSDAAGID